MHKLRVTEKEFKSLFDKDADPAEREKIYKRLKLMCIDYPVLAERILLLEEKLAKAQVKAGKFDQIKKNLKLKIPK